MSECPEDIRYTKSHEWVRREEGNIVTVGITDHAQQQLGDLVYVELPKMNQIVNPGAEIAVVESVKTAADVYSPLAGEIIAVNEKLNASPHWVNKDPYGQGWLFRLKVADFNLFEQLLDSAAYQKEIA